MGSFGIAVLLGAIAIVFSLTLIGTFMSDKSEVKLIVTSTKPEFSQDEDVVIDVVFENKAKHAIWLNGRMLVNTEHAPGNYREITLLITRNGTKLPFEAKVRAGDVSDEAYIAIKATESKSKSICLSDLFDLDQEGEFKVIVEFNDGNPSPPVAPQNSAYIKGPLKSKEFWFTVLGE